MVIFFPVPVSIGCVVSRKARTSCRWAQLPLKTSIFHSHFNFLLQPYKELFKFGRYGWLRLYINSNKLLKKRNEINLFLYFYFPQLPLKLIMILLFQNQIALCLKYKFSSLSWALKYYCCIKSWLYKFDLIILTT